MKSLLPYNGNLEQELPIPVRLEVYKKAKEVISEGVADKYGLLGPWLCLILPCILWDLKNYTNSGPEEYCWTAKNTLTAFPELTIEVIIHLEETKINPTLLRLQYVKNWIQQLENQIENEQTTI